MAHWLLWAGSKVEKWTGAKEAYRAYLYGRGRSPDTIENAIAALNVFEHWSLALGTRPLQAGKSTIANYIAWLHQNKAPATVRNRVLNLKSFWEYLFTEGYVSTNPLADIKPPVIPSVPIRPYTRRDLEKLRAALRTPRDAALFYLYFGTGLRASEILQLRAGDVDFVAGTLRVRRTKGRKALTSCAGHRAMAAVRFYMASERIKEGWLFPGQNGGHLRRNSLWYWIRALARRAGVPAANIHRFRHTFGHQFLEAGGQVGDLQLLLGHSKIETTLNYVAYGAHDRALEQQRRFNPADRL